MIVPPRIALAVVAGMALLHGCSRETVPAEAPPGTHFDVEAATLPAPAEDEAVAEVSDTIARPEGATLAVPAGFHAALFAADLPDARFLAVAPNGDVLLARSQPGRITVLRDVGGTGRADRRFTFATGLDLPYGIAFHDGFVYVADIDGVRRYPWNAADGTAGGPAEPVTARGAFGPDGSQGHTTRNIVFAPDGRHFFVAIGSRSNIADDPAPRATIQMFDAAGGAGTTYASGLRNPVGLAFQPGTGTLWTVVNERDGLGDGLVPDYLTSVRPGGFYGWPFSYIGGHPQPGPLGRERPDLVARAIVPDLLFQAHSAPLGLVFYTGTQFPADYRGDAFVSLHGSWNSSRPTGYKVVRVRFRDGRPVGGYDNFATGFRVGGTVPARVWGRPVGLAVAKDGSLLVADDVGGAVWRVWWDGR